MKNTKRLLSLALAAMLVLALAGCDATATLKKLLGTTETEEVDTSKWAAASSDTVTLPEGMDSTAKFATQGLDGALYVVFNGIWNKNTDYFTAPGGTLTFTAAATAESTKLQKFKISVWRRVDGGCEYVSDSTVYFKTDDTPYSFTLKGLDPAESYRLTISYDSSYYYLYGRLRVDGVA